MKNRIKRECLRNTSFHYNVFIYLFSYEGKGQRGGG